MTVFYPDVSNFEAGISLNGALVACAKATEGTTYLSPDYARAKSAAAAQGALFFAYHFLHAGNAGAQATWAFKHVGKTPLMLDVESTSGSSPGISDILTFLASYRALGGVCHVVYLPKWYWQDIGSPSLVAASEAGLVLVSSSYGPYSDASSATGWLPYGGVTPTIWQYTDNLSFNGFACDFNAFRGTHAGDQSAAAVKDTLAEFEEILTTGKIKPPTPVGDVVIPKTYGEAAATAIAKIENAGLKVVTNPLRDPKNEYESIGSKPIGGTAVPKGSTVTLNVQVTKKG